MEHRKIIIFFEITGMVLLCNYSVAFSQQIVFRDDDVDVDNRYDVSNFGQNQFNPSDDNPFGIFGRPNRRPRPRPTEFPDFRPTFSSTFRPPSTITPGTTTTRLPDTYFSCVAQCPITSQYNPVCATNMQSYDNMSRLRCARQCGLNVDMVHLGLCRPRGK